jgi:D-alanyl-D-alanine carboxypeptidase
MPLFALLMAMVLGTNVLHADQIDDYLNNQLQAAPVPGISLTILKDGREVKTASYGVANLELDVPTTRLTVFEVGALSGEFTKAGILLLNEAGKLSMDDPISRHLPGTPSTWKDVTIRHCMSHSSGVKSYSFIEGFELRYHLSQIDFIRLIGEYPLEFEPGTKYSYSPTDATILAHIIANVSGQPYWSFLQQKIFKPLQMSAIYNRDPIRVIPNRANGYVKIKSGGFSNRDYDLTDMFGSADVTTSVVDFAKWDDALNSNKILSDSSRKLFWTGEAGRNSGYIFRSGKLKGQTEYSHIGATGGFSAAHLRYPDSGISIILFANNNEPNLALALGRGVANLYLGSN